MHKIILSLFLATALSFSLTGSASAQPPACPRVTADTTLTSDCLGPLVVNASAVNVSLNGFEVTCPSLSGPGINITNQTDVDVLGPGKVTDCGVGVFMSGGGDHTVRALEITGNLTGISSSESNGNDIIENTVRGIFEGNGVASLRSDLGKIEDNLIQSHIDGVLLIDSHQNSVRQNTLLFNTTAGARLFDSDFNRIDLNTVRGNFIVGIVLGVGSENNLVEKNDATNILGVFDLLDGNDNCDANVWRDNIFDTANQDCIS